MLEDLILFGKLHADPWHRMNCSTKPIFLFIEFCQIEGPKPLIWFPKDIGPHIDLDQIALWVMSSENNHASLSFMFNQQIGLYALVQYSTILDLSARAFQRPFALVWLTNSKPDVNFVCQFHEKCIALFYSFLACNRQYFQSLIQHLLQLVESNESENFDNYYALFKNNKEFPSKSKFLRQIQNIASQSKEWYNRGLEGKNVYITNYEAKCSCGVDKKELEKFLPYIMAHCTSSKLIQLLELSPCQSSTFMHTFEKLYVELALNKNQKGLLFSCKVPILRSFLGAHSEFGYEKDDEIFDLFEENLINEIDAKKKSRLKSLKLISSGLINCIFHLLSGDHIAILASKQKERFAIDMLQKLSSLKMSKRFDKPLWFFDNNIELKPQINQLAGFLCNAETSLKWSNSNYPIVIDLNYQRIKCREYSGKFLNVLHNTNIQSFPSDKSALTYIVSILTDLNQYILLAKHLSPKIVVDCLNLSICDQLILINSLIEINITKYCFLRKNIQNMSNNLKRVKL